MSDNNNLKDVLAKHQQWLDDKGGERANLSYANLRYADLSDSDLNYVSLRNANLRNADLSGANLRNADLRYDDLSGANLRNADLRNADLRNAGVVVVGICSWHGCVTRTHVHIGCIRVESDDLLKRDAAGTVGELHRDAERWWKIGRGVVLAAIEAVRTVSDE